MSYFRDAQLVLEAHKFYPAYVLIGLSLMEVIRFSCSSQLHQTQQQQRIYYKKLIL